MAEQDNIGLLKELLRRYKALLTRSPTKKQAKTIRQRICEAQQQLHNEETGGCVANLEFGGASCENPMCSWPVPPALVLSDDDDIPF